MRSTFLTSAAVLMFTAAPALAQSYGTSVPQTSRAPGAAASTAAAPAAPALCPMKLSNSSRKALLEYQAAHDAKDAARIATATAAATAAAKTKEDKCVLGQLMLKAAAGRSDYTSAGAAVDMMVQSGAANPAALGLIAASVGKMRFQAKDYAGAAASFDQALALAPNDPEALVLSGEAKVKLNQTAAGLDQFGKAFAMRTAAGQPIDETWLKRAVALSYESKNPKVYAFSRQWVSAYPAAKNWRDTLKIYQVVSGLPTSELLDVYRLQRANKALMGEADYVNYAVALLQKGYPGEAKAVLSEGIAAGTIKQSSPSIGPILATATAKAVGDRAALDGAAKAATASADGKKAMTIADAYLGYGDYAKAATLYRAALTKSGTDTAIANLRLGMALAMSGDKAGAQAALSAVSGPKAEIAQFWMTYLAQRA